MNLIVRSGLVLVLLLAIAGCGNDASSTPVGSTGSGASAPPSSSSAPASPGSSGSAKPSASSSLVLPHDDPALEDRLPDDVAGKQLFKLSVGPVSSAGNVGAEPIKAMAKEIGDGSGNFGLAFANDPTDPTYNFFALRVPGAASAELVEKYAALTIADTRGAEADQATLGGRTVTHVTAPGNPIGDVWFYAIDDTLFGVQAGSAEKATTLLALLP
jgi:hypothetical protein